MAAPTLTENSNQNGDETENATARTASLRTLRAGALKVALGTGLSAFAVLVASWLIETGPPADAGSIPGWFAAEPLLRGQQTATALGVGAIAAVMFVATTVAPQIVQIHSLEDEARAIAVQRLELGIYLVSCGFGWLVVISALRDSDTVAASAGLGLVALAACCASLARDSELVRLHSRQVAERKVAEVRSGICSLRSDLLGTRWQSRYPRGQVRWLVGAALVLLVICIVSMLATRHGIPAGTRALVGILLGVVAAVMFCYSTVGVVDAIAQHRCPGRRGWLELAMPASMGFLSWLLTLSLLASGARLPWGVYAIILLAPLIPVLLYRTGRFRAFAAMRLLHEQDRRTRSIQSIDARTRSADRGRRLGYL